MQPYPSGLHEHLRVRQFLHACSWARTTGSCLSLWCIWCAPTHPTCTFPAADEPAPQASSQVQAAPQVQGPAAGTPASSSTATQAGPDDTNSTAAAPGVTAPAGPQAVGVETAAQSARTQQTGDWRDWSYYRNRGRYGYRPPGDSAWGW